MQLVLLNSPTLPRSYKIHTIPPAAQNKSKSSQLWPSTLSLLWPSLTTSTCRLYMCVCARVCMCAFHVLYLLFIKRNCFVFQFVGSSFPFKAVSSWVGPTCQTDFIVLTSKSKQTILVLPWPKVSQRSLPLSTASAAAAAKSLQSCPTLSDPMDCSPPGSSIHGIFQARVLAWGAIAFSISQLLLPSESLTIPLSIFHPCSNLLTLLLWKPPECS